MDIQKEREAFEAWVIENLAEGRSMSWEDWCWKAWQAKAKSVPEGFVLVPAMPSDEFIDKLADVICNEFDTTISGSAHCAREAYKAMVSSCEP